MSVLSRNDACPKGEDLAPGSPSCQKCRSFIGKKMFPLQGLSGVFCQEVTEDWEVKTHLDECQV